MHDLAMTLLVALILVLSCSLAVNVKGLFPETEFTEYTNELEELDSLEKLAHLAEGDYDFELKDAVRGDQYIVVEHSGSGSELLRHDNLKLKNIVFLY